MNLPDHFVASNKFGRYCVPKSSSHRPASQTILAGEVWEEDTISLIARNCADGDVVHAGAFFGDFLPALSRALSPGARLWAFEPSRENFLCAQETVALNDLTNLTLTNAGLGARRRTGSLCVSSIEGAHGGASRFVDRETPGEVYENAEIVSLDDVIPHDRHISILQLDVENYEQQALKGGLELLKRCRPLLILELLPQNLKWHERNILSLGYRLSGLVQHNRVLTTAEREPQGFEDLMNKDRQRVERRAQRRAARRAAKADANKAS